MNGATRYFSDVEQPRHYRTTLPTGQQEGVYSQQQAIYPEYGRSLGAEPPVVDSRLAGGPWWIQPEQAQIYRTGGDVRVVQSNQLRPEDVDLYERYLTSATPYDVIVDGDRDRDSRGRRRKSDYSGYWRCIGDPYHHSEQPQVAYVDRRPVQQGFVRTEEYSPYGYQAVIPPAAAVSRQVITSPVERRIYNSRPY